MASEMGIARHVARATCIAAFDRARVTLIGPLRFFRREIIDNRIACQILIGGMASLLICVFLGPRFIEFLRDGGTVYRTWYTSGRGVEQLSHMFPLMDVLPYGRQEEWQHSPEDWPQSPTGSGWASSQDIASRYGPSS